MTNYIRTNHNAYPHTEASIRSANPQTSFPALFRADGYAVVFPAPAPTYDAITQYVREIAPELTVLGHWEQRWEVLALDAGTIATNQAAAQTALVKYFTDAVQAHLDNAAAALGYDNIVSACSYAGAANPYQAEGQSFIVWRGNVWTYCYGELAKVQAQTRSVPTVAALIAELPVRA